MDAKRIKRIKVCIGLLSNRGFKPKTVLALLKMIAESKKFDFHFALIETGYTIAENRNYLAMQAIKNDCDYLFMCDDDMLFPTETLKVMVSRDKDIIGLPYNVKILFKEGQERRDNITYLPNDTAETVDKSAPFEVLAIGGGVMLIKTEVFKNISQPYFSVESYDFGMTKIGEDSVFCYKAEEKGFKVWCEPTLKELGHIGDFTY